MEWMAFAETLITIVVTLVTAALSIGYIAKTICRERDRYRHNSYNEGMNLFNKYWPTYKKCIEAVTHAINKMASTM